MVEWGRHARDRALFSSSHLGRLLQPVATLADRDVERQLGHPDAAHGVGGLVLLLRGEWGEGGVGRRAAARLCAPHHGPRPRPEHGCRPGGRRRGGGEQEGGARGAPRAAAAGWRGAQGPEGALPRRAPAHGSRKAPSSRRGAAPDRPVARRRAPTPPTRRAVPPPISASADRRALYLSNIRPRTGMAVAWGGRDRGEGRIGE